jgi:hypothetical protein
MPGLRQDALLGAGVGPVSEGGGWCAATQQTMPTDPGHRGEYLRTTALCLQSCADKGDHETKVAGPSD